MKISWITKDDVIEIWQKWWWKEEFYKQIVQSEPFWKAFLRSVNSLDKTELNNKILKFSCVYFPWVVNDVRAFQKRISWILFWNSSWTIESILLALWETRKRVSDILEKVDESKKRVAMVWIRPKSEMINKSMILSIWNNWWREKFEEFIWNWMSFWEALIKSVREIDWWLKEISLRFSSITTWWKWCFISLISKTIGLNTTNMKDILNVLYEWDDEKVDYIIETIKTTNKKKNDMKISRMMYNKKPNV